MNEYDDDQNEKCGATDFFSGGVNKRHEILAQPESDDSTVYCALCVCTCWCRIQLLDGVAIGIPNNGGLSIKQWLLGP